MQTDKGTGPGRELEDSQEGGPELAIRSKALRKSYGSVEALQGLDLAVRRHSIFGLLGPNGAGKSTTIKLLTRQVAPTSGQAWVAGAPISGQTTDVRSRIGYLSEQPAFYNWMRGDEFLDFVGQIFCMAPSVYRARRSELLEMVGLTGAARRKIGGYSHGMRQRLGIAQALMNSPEVLLLDEPVSALDPIGRKEVLEFFERLRGQTTIFFSSHILADVDRVCDEVAVLDHGLLLAQEPIAKLKERYTRPIIEVETASSLDELVRLARQETYVREVQTVGTQARIVVSDLEVATRALPGLIATANLGLIRFQVATPTLEDVFVQLIAEQPVQEGAKS